MNEMSFAQQPIPQKDNKNNNVRENDLAEIQRGIDAANGIVDTEAWETDAPKKLSPPPAPQAPGHMRALPAPDAQPRLEQAPVRPMLTVPEKQAQLADLRERAIAALPTPDRVPALPAPGERGPRKLDLRVIDVSAIVEQVAHREAEEKLNEFLNDKNVNFLKRWLARTGEKGQYNKFFRESKDAILNNRNLMATIEARLSSKGDVRTDAAGADRSYQVLDEIMKAYEQNAVEEDENKGEKIENHAAINTEISAIMMRYAMGEITDRAIFEEEVDSRVVRPFLGHRKFAEDNKGNKKSDEQGLMFATNLFEQANLYKEEVKQTIAEAEAKFGKENGEAIRNYVKGTFAIDIQLGKKERDLVNRYPQGRLGLFDKIVDTAQSIPVLGKMASPLLAGVAGWGIGQGIVSIAGRAGVGYAAKAVALKVGAPLLAAVALGGGFAAMRKGTELLRDRGMEMRRDSLGEEAGGKKAQKVREFNYEQEDAQKIIGDLRAIDPAQMTEQQKLRVAEVLALLQIEKEKGVDTIRVDAQEGVDFKSRLRSLNSLKSELNRVTAGLGGKSAFSEQMQGQIKVFYDGKEAEIIKKDSEFASFKRWEMVKAGVMGSVFGLAGGFIGQKLVAAVNHGFEGGVSGAGQKLANWFHSGPRGVLGADMAQDHTLIAPDGSKMRLPDNVMFVKDAAGHAMVVDMWGHAYTPVFDANNAAAMQEALGHAGFTPDAQHLVIPGHEFGGSLHTEILNGGAQTIELPEGMSAHAVGDGSFDIMSKSGKAVYHGLKFGADGKLDSASKAFFVDNGWNVREGVPQVISHKLDKAGVLKYLEDRFGHAEGKRLDWHANGTPMHTDPAHYDAVTKMEPEMDLKDVHQRFETEAQIDDFLKTDSGTKINFIKQHLTGADGKELQLKLFGKGGERVLSMKDMMTNMMKHGAKNWDGTRDGEFPHLKWAVQSKDLAAVAENFKLRVGGVDIPLDANGELHVPKGDPLYDVLFDKLGKLKMTVEAIMPDPKGGFHTLATGVGHGHGGAVINEMRSTISLDHPPTDAATDVTFLKGGPVNDPAYDEWFNRPVATPEYFRGAMEKGKKPVAEVRPWGAASAPEPAPAPMPVRGPVRRTESMDPPIPIRRTRETVSAEPRPQPSRIREALKPPVGSTPMPAEMARVVDLENMRRRAEAAAKKKPEAPPAPQPEPAKSEAPKPAEAAEKLPKGVVKINKTEDLLATKLEMNALDVKIPRVFVLSKDYFNNTQGKTPNELVNAFEKMISRVYKNAAFKYEILRGDKIDDANMSAEIKKAQARMKNPPAQPQQAAA